MICLFLFYTTSIITFGIYELCLTSFFFFFFCLCFPHIEYLIFWNIVHILNLANIFLTVKSYNIHKEALVRSITVLTHLYGDEEDSEYLQNIVGTLQLKQPPNLSSSNNYESWKTLLKHEILIFAWNIQSWSIFFV